MDNDSTDRLKFDKRLATRRGWVDAAELERELAELPDAADKAHVAGDEPRPTDSAASEGAAPSGPGDGMPGA